MVTSSAASFRSPSDDPGPGGPDGAKRNPGQADPGLRFAPSRLRFVRLLHMGDETPSLVVVHYCHETTCLIDDVLFHLLFFHLAILWSAVALHRFLFHRNEILMVPLRIAPDIVPRHANFVA